MYQLKLEQFSGPLEKLLELIESKKLEITELNLAEVTADFINYLKTIETVEPRLLADFIVVASRLLLIKSKALLPNLELTDEEEEGIKDLEERLKKYQNFKPAISFFKKIWDRQDRSFSRSLFFGRPPVFYPSENLNKEVLKQAIDSVFEIFKQLSPEVHTIRSSLISLEEKIEEIIERFKSGRGYFKDLIKEKSRPEIIVFFLALLHLLRDQIIKVEQKEKFSDIIIEKK